MKKEYRIKKNEEIEKILRKKNSCGNKNYIIYVTKNLETNHFRLGMSVGKKVGNAVVRNREKRHIKNVVKELEINIKNYNIFIIARPNCLTLSYDEIKQNIKKLLKHIDVWYLEEK